MYHKLVDGFSMYSVGVAGNSDDALIPAAVKRASMLVLMLLSEVMVHCANCNKDVKVYIYSSHKCACAQRDEK